MILELDAATFDSSVRDGITLVDFSAPWCGPCHYQTPILEKIAEEHSDTVRVATVNVDQAFELAKRFHIKAVPSLFVIKDGRVVEKFVGVQREDALMRAIRKAER
jgi:thioredoxin 1